MPIEDPSASTEREAPAPASAEARAAGALAERLVHLLPLAALFPVQNRRFGEAAEEVLAALAAVRGARDAVALEVRRGLLAIGSCGLLPESPAVEHLLQLLDRLGIARIEIDRAASPADLHHLAALLRRLQASAAGTRLERVDLEGLPPSIRVRAHEFGRRIQGETVRIVRTEAIERAVLRSLEPLEAAGLDGPEGLLRAAARERLTRGFAQAVERLDLAPADGAPPGRSTARALEDVLDLGVAAIRSALQAELRAGAGSLELRRVFAAAERALALSDDERSARVMIEVLKNAAEESADLGADAAPEEASGARAEDRACETLPVEEIARLLADLGQGPPPAAALESPRERLSLLFELLLRFPGPGPLLGIEAGLEEVLKRAPGPEEQAVLAAGLRALCAQPDPALVDRSLPRIAIPMRRLRSESFAAVLLEAVQPADDAAVHRIWPHCAGELLLGFDLDFPQIEAELRAIVLGLPAAELQPAVRRLLRLKSFRPERASRAAVLSLPAPFEPVLAEVLERGDSAPFADLLLRRWRASPPPWLPSPAIAALRGADSASRQLVAAVLREGAAAPPSPRARSLAAAALGRALQSLSPPRRRENWVPGAIGAFQALAGRESTGLLREIATARRSFLRHAWPSACRRAARAASGPGASAATGGTQP